MSKGIHLPNTTLIVTLRCNLKCKLCAVGAPFLKNPEQYPFEVLKKTIDRYFEAVDFIDKFTINGGEPFVYPHLAQVMEYLVTYIDRIGMLEIITNGSIMANETLIAALKKSEKIDILIDDYGPELSKAVDSMIERFTKEGIRFRRRPYCGNDPHKGGWVDLSNICLKDRSKEETTKLYKNCVYPGVFNCFVIYGGKAYICGVYYRSVWEGIIPDNLEDEYVDFNTDDWNVERVKEKIVNFYDRPHFTACEYCDGFCADSKRFPPAEQVK